MRQVTNFGSDFQMYVTITAKLARYRAGGRSAGSVIVPPTSNPSLPEASSLGMPVPPRVRSVSALMVSGGAVPPMPMVDPVAVTVPGYRIV